MSRICKEVIFPHVKHYYQVALRETKKLNNKIGAWLEQRRKQKESEAKEAKEAFHLSFLIFKIIICLVVVISSIAYFTGWFNRSLQGTWSQGTPGVFTPTLEFRSDGSYVFNGVKQIGVTWSGETLVFDEVHLDKELKNKNNISRYDFYLSRKCGLVLTGEKGSILKPDEGSLSLDSDRWREGENIVCKVHWIDANHFDIGLNSFNRVNSVKVER